MRRLTIALMSIGLLAACSKPSEPSNPPVASEQNREAMQTASGDNSFTEDQAREHIAKAGYTDVTDMKQDAQGVWRGTAKKNGQTTAVSVDYQGTVKPG